jgi:hypothetical protein
VRILLATDAASEGIDLQRHCHRLLHVEIPWNPNRLEQRNGRVDRHGQPSPTVLIHHFVGAGWEHSPPGSLEADLQFLHVAAQKVEAIRDDLGSVGPVIAEQVEEAMVGRRRGLDTRAAEQASPSRRVLRVERDLREEIARLRAQLDVSVTQLNITPDTLERVVRVALELACQPWPTPATLTRPGGETIDRGVFDMPQLTGSWARATIGLERPVTGTRRSITFSHDIAAGHDDVVLVHLGHRLVQQSLRLLRAEMWATSPTPKLARVTARLVPHTDLDELAEVAHGRLVITGADGRRLHEEVIAAGGRVRGGRFARMNVGETDAVLAAATDRSPAATVLPGLAGLWDSVSGPLTNALSYRAHSRADSLASMLAQRAEEETTTITAVLTDLQRMIAARLHRPEMEQLRLELDPDQRQQLDLDVDALGRRLASIPAEITAETETIRRRYAATEPRHFPVAVTFLVPERLGAGPVVGGR